MLEHKDTMTPDFSRRYITQKTAIFILQYLIIFYTVTTEIYFLSLPAIAQTLNASDKLANLSVSLYFLGIVLSQMFYGIYSDYWGRKKALFIGIVINMLGIYVCINATQGYELLLGKFIQGIGIASCVCLPRSIIRDLSSGKSMSKIYSYASIAMEISGIVAPILGSYIQYYRGWHTLFAVLFVMGSVALLLILFMLPETLISKSVHKKKVASVFAGFASLSKNKTFIGSALCSSFAAASIYIYLTATAFIYQNVLSISLPTYGLLTSVISMVLIVGFMLNIRFVQRYGLLTLLSMGIVMMLISSLLMFGSALLYAPEINLLSMLLSFSMFALGTSFVFPNCLALGTQKASQSQIGLALSLYSTIQFAGIFLIILFEATYYKSSAVMLSSLFLVISVLSLILFYTLISDRNRESFFNVIQDALAFIPEWGVRGILGRMKLAYFVHRWKLRQLEKRDAFDKTYGTDTTRKLRVSRFNMSPQKTKGAIMYWATPASMFHDMMASLKISFEAFVFVDLGCGKGRTLCLASQYGFKQLIGVELSPKLADIAQNNLKLCVDKVSQPEPYDIQCINALAYHFPTQSCVIYLFNPFDPTTLQQVLDKLHKTQRSKDAEVILIYLDPTDEHLPVLQSTHFLKLIQHYVPEKALMSTGQFAWYVYAVDCSTFNNNLSEDKRNIP